MQGKHSADAVKLVDELAAIAAAHPDDSTAQAYAAWGRGLLAWMKGDPGAAVRELSDTPFVQAFHDLAIMERAAGDHAAANESDQIMATGWTDNEVALYYATKLAARE